MPVRSLSNLVLSVPFIVAAGSSAAQSLDGPSPSPADLPATPEIQRLPVYITLAGLTELIRRIAPKPRTKGLSIQFHVQEQTRRAAGRERVSQDWEVWGWAVF